MLFQFPKRDMVDTDLAACVLSFGIGTRFQFPKRDMVDTDLH